MATCWSCGQEPGPEPFCAKCGTIQPGRPRDLFQVLGLSRRFHLDEAEVESRHRQLSRKLHPDRFARATPRERRFSVEQTTLINEAVKKLRDPVRRAEYLLESEGVQIASEEKGSRQLPLEFYEEVMEDREALLEAKTEGPEAVRALTEKILARRALALATVEKALTAWEGGAGPGVLEPAATELAKLRYYARFLEEVEGRLTL